MRDDDIASGLAAEDVEKAELRRKLYDAERRLLAQGDLAAQLDEERRRATLIERELSIRDSLGHRDEPPKWLTAPPKSRSDHHATPVLLLSDLHLDEVVSADQVLGVNKYDRAIAEQRLRRTAENFVKLCRDYWSGLTYDGVLLPLAGDLFSGDIHDELKETNADTMLGSLDHWIDHLAAVVSMMAGEFGKVHVPVVVGNHGRTTRKPRAKFRARSNFDWFVGRELMRLFRNDPSVTFDVSESADCPVKVYDQTIMFSHGDQANGGQGIGGIWPPLMRLDARKRQRQAAVKQPYDLMAVGHWHTLVFGPSFIINGSMKGYDEYAFTENFGYEVPQQAAWLQVPRHGKTWTAPVFCQDRSAEGW